MNKETIRIRNLGPVTNIAIEDIRPVTILHGENNLVKSLISKTLALFRWLHKRDNIAAYMKSANVGIDDVEIELFNSSENNLYPFINKKTEIIYTNGEYSITYKNSKLIRKNENLLEGDDNLHLEKICFIGSERVIVSHNVSCNDYGFVDDVQDLFDTAMREMEKYKPKHLPDVTVERQRKKYTGGLEYFIKNKGCTVNPKGIYPMKDCALDIKSSIPIMTICDYFTNHYDIGKNFNTELLRYLAEVDRLKDFSAKTNIGDIKNKRICFHIEDPEIGLTSNQECFLYDGLMQACFGDKAKYDVNLFITTNSSHLKLYVTLYHRREKNAIINEGDLIIYNVSKHGDGIDPLYIDGQHTGVSLFV